MDNKNTQKPGSRYRSSDGTSTPGVPGKHSSKNKFVTVIALSCSLIFLLAGCETGSSSASTDNQLSLTVPTVLAQARAVNRSALFADLELTYGEVTKTETATRQGTSDIWSATLIIPTGVPYTLAVTWYDNASGQRLNLASVSQEFEPFTNLGAASVSIDFNDFDTDAFDADDDLISNLQERVDDTDPFDPLSPGTAPDPQGPIPVVLSACDSLPIATEVASNDPANPINIAAGTLHSGQVISDTFGYYTASLDAGHYLLVVDAQDISGITNTAIAVDLRDSAGEYSQRLVESLDLDKLRVLSDFTLASPDTIALRVSEHEITTSRENIYTMGIFNVGEPVPSPFFTDCPTVIDVVDGVPVSFEFESGYDNEVFLAFDVATIEAYEADLFLANIRGAGGIFARVTLTDEYGQLDKGATFFNSRVAFINTSSDTDSQTAPFTPGKTGRNWLRFRKRIWASLNNRYSVQVTLSEVPSAGGQ